jgi:hypothetical protein
MAIDPYSPCPGGTGKKIKFCCSELMGDLEQIERLTEGQQYAAALAEVDRLTAERAAAAAAAARNAFDSAVGECAAAACARKSIARCTRCRRVGYCGVACQKAHWVVHKAVCTHK